MRNKPISLMSSLLFNLTALALILSIFVYRTDLGFAQGGADDSETPVLTPRKTQVEDDADDADDDDDEGDDQQVYTYVVQPGDNLWRIARQLGLPYAVLAAQTDNPRRIFAGQVFTYSSEQVESRVSVTTVTVSQGDGDTYTFTVRAGDTLSHIAMWLGVPLEMLAEQVEDPSSIQPGQIFSYVSDRRIDTPPLLTDNDGTDSDGIDTTGIYTDGDGYDTTGQFTDNDGTDSDGIDTTGQFTDNDGTDSDGIDTTGQFTDNDGTDSDGIDTTGQFTDNDGTDSDGIDTTGQQDDTDIDDTDDTADSDDSD